MHPTYSITPWVGSRLTRVVYLRLVMRPFLDCSLLVRWLVVCMVRIGSAVLHYLAALFLATWREAPRRPFCRTLVRGPQDALLAPQHSSVHGESEGSVAASSGIATSPPSSGRKSHTIDEVVTQGKGRHLRHRRLAGVRRNQVPIRPFRRRESLCGPGRVQHAARSQAHCAVCPRCGAEVGGTHFVPKLFGSGAQLVLRVTLYLLTQSSWNGLRVSQTKLATLHGPERASEGSLLPPCRPVPGASLYTVRPTVTAALASLMGLATRRRFRRCPHNL